MKDASPGLFPKHLQLRVHVSKGAHRRDGPANLMLSLRQRLALLEREQTREFFRPRLDCVGEC
ncbi:hypothetical protein D9M72_610150 [compost metagenome]